jgi:hypothetical protein
MQHTNDANAPVATQINYPEHFSSEESNVHLYIPKGMEYATSMQKTRFQIPAEIYGPVRNHAVVALTTSANIVDRRRSLAQLRTMAANGDEQASAVLDAMVGLVIEGER